MTQQDDITQRLRDNADLDEAEHGNARVVQLEREAADEIERLRAELSKLRAPVADAPVCQRCGGTGEADSGGIHPWGAPALIPCECTVSAPLADERAAFVAWLTGSYPDAYSEPEALRLWHHEHVAALAWEERGRRAALASAPVAGEADQDEMERLGWVNIGYKHDLEKARRAISFCKIPGFDTMSLDNAIYWLRAKADDAAPQASAEDVRNAALEDRDE